LVKRCKIKATTFNARAEFLEQNKLFTTYFKPNRCLVPADAFYEWKKLGKLKQHMCIKMKDEKPFMFAGIFSV
jgi:putative SOS response-associated peptidase YedK